MSCLKFKLQLQILVIINRLCIHMSPFYLSDQQFTYYARVKSNPLTLYDAVLPVLLIFACTLITARERQGVVSDVFLFADLALLYLSM